ncbi:unnamed protein product [Leptosia nina]|uniref:Uncharacterized protein n=1 Tax=Leptosia nina TaxID=320188 RepID=A0AAV1JJT7_9NEOP
MQKKNELSNDKIAMSRARSFMTSADKKFKNDSVKRKSFLSHGAVNSLDLALSRIKKTKLANGEYFCTSSHTSPSRRTAPGDIFIDSLTSASNVDTCSMMSMNFSHYELMRNLSQSNCNSDTAFSATTLNAASVPRDSMSRNEHLERYFRSVETWKNSSNRGANDK